MNYTNTDIPLKVQQIVESINHLDANDKYLINKLMWNELEIPKIHQKLVGERIQKSKENPDRLLDWDIVSKDY